MYYRFKPQKDTYISEYYSGSNFGDDELLVVGNPEMSDGTAYRLRSLLQFNVTDISSSRASGKIGTASQYELKLFECQSKYTMPDNFFVDVYLISQSWNEGTGSVIGPNGGAVVNWEGGFDTGFDVGYAVAGPHGGGFTNWDSASSTAAWTTTGSDYLTFASVSQHFPTGSGDLTVNISKLINPILSGTYNDYGLLIKIRSEETFDDFVPKYFYGKNTNTIYQPVLYAKWNDAISTSSVTASSTWKDYNIHVRHPKDIYKINEKVRFALFNRLQYPTFSYTTWSFADLSNTPLPNLTYQIEDVVSNDIIVSYNEYTSCSYNDTENYFYINMNILEPYRSYKLSVRHQFLSTTLYYDLHEFRTSE